jgi:hypothetical protein
MATLTTSSIAPVPQPVDTSSISTRIRFGKPVIAALCLGLAIANTGTAAAQALATASRSFAMAPFAQGTYMTQPGYSQPANLGFAAGLDIAPPISFGALRPSVELRVTADSGSAAREYTYTPGIKLATVIHGIRPYATVLGGAGTVYFDHPSVQGHKGLYAHDSSPMLSLGGGAEFDISRVWQLRLDYTRQFWALNQNFVANLPLGPSAFSIGASYRVRPRGDAVR